MAPRLVPLVLLVGILPACGGPSDIEGKYYNTVSGEFAMELKDGKVLSGQGMEGMNLVYRVRGDSLVLDDLKTPDPEDLVLGIGKDGSLSAGPLGSVKKKQVP